MQKTALLSALLYSLGAYLSVASDLVPIGTVLSFAESYHLRAVTLQGKVRRVQTIAPYTDLDGCVQRDSYAFLLEDETGSIEVDVRGPCASPSGTMVSVTEGDRVVVQALIHAFTPDRSDRMTVQAVAKSIQRLGD